MAGRKRAKKDRKKTKKDAKRTKKMKKWFGLVKLQTTLLAVYEVVVAGDFMISSISCSSKLGTGLRFLNRSD